jgi:hypothetical protein
MRRGGVDDFEKFRHEVETVTRGVEKGLYING